MCITLVARLGQFWDNFAICELDYKRTVGNSVVCHVFENLPKASRKAVEMLAEENPWKWCKNCSERVIVWMEKE